MVQGTIKATLALGALFLLFNREPQVKIYNRSGIINHEIRLWIDTITVTSASGFSIDISSAGFSGITTVSAEAIRNTGALTSVPSCHVKTIGTSTLFLNLTEENSTTINLLGSLVLLGAPLQFVSNTSGLQVAIVVIGY